MQVPELPSLPVSPGVAPEEEPEWIAEVEEDFQRNRIILPTKRLSMSQIGTFRMCPACYRAQYVERRPEEKRSGMGVVGAAVAAGLAKARTLNRTHGPIYQDEVIGATRAEFFNRIMGVDEKWGKTEDRSNELAPIDWKKLGDRDKALDKAMAMVDTAVKAFVLNEDPEMYHAIEAELHYEKTFPFGFTGYMDVLFKHPAVENGVILEDDKTQNEPGPRPYKTNDVWQLAAYVLPMKDSGLRWQTRIGQITTRGYVPAKKAEKERLSAAGYDWNAPVATLIPVRVTKADVEWVRSQVVKTAWAISVCYREDSFPISDSNWHKFPHGGPAAPGVEAFQAMFPGAYFGE